MFHVWSQTQLARELPKTYARGWLQLRAASGPLLRQLHTVQRSRWSCVTCARVVVEGSRAAHCSRLLIGCAVRLTWNIMLHRAARRIHARQVLIRRNRIGEWTVFVRMRLWGFEECPGLWAGDDWSTIRPAVGGM